MIPSNPAMLVSLINMKLRDGNEDLESLCAACNWNQKDLLKELEAAGFTYCKENRCFKEQGKNESKN